MIVSVDTAKFCRLAKKRVNSKHNEENITSLILDTVQGDSCGSLYLVDCLSWATILNIVELLSIETIVPLNTLVECTHLGTSTSSYLLVPCEKCSVDYYY